MRFWLLVVALAAVEPRPAAAWGDEGHRVVALIAQSYLTPTARSKVEALLAADTDTLTAPDIASAATWADRLRDVNRDGAKAKTGKWHFVDLEIEDGARGPNLDTACYRHLATPLGPPPGTPASAGPADSCVVDKTQQFVAELADPATSPQERIVALKYVLHFVGDLHQPLHASDQHDRGGNDKKAAGPGEAAANLHRYWDVIFVERLGEDAHSVAASLRQRITPQAVRAWSQGSVSDWVMESFRMGRDDVYGKLPPAQPNGRFVLTERYMTMATQDAALQLQRAGVRLAVVLNRALGRP